MAPPVPFSKLTLSYPLYACDFDPSNSSKLVVGGGGGAGRNGVGNKITVLNTSQPDVLEEVCEVNLSKEEDNVTSLAVGKTVGKTTLVYAGINSSSKDLESGKNEHYRTFGVETTTKGKQKITETKISELGRSKLFHGRDKDAYQRILRLSRPYPKGPQLGAVTTGLSKSPEIVVFDTSTSPPKIRGDIVPVNEAEDVDMIQTGDGSFEFAYCDKHNVYLKTISEETEASDPFTAYATPNQDNVGSVPSFRSLRFLTPSFLLMLTNIASNTGVVLQVLRIDPERKLNARVNLSKRLHSSLKKATGMAVVNLSPPLSPGEKQDGAQFAVAVAGHDCSISLFTLEYQIMGNVDQFAKLNCVKIIKNVHPNIMTNLAFSTFIPPPHPVAGETKPQYIKLASVSMVNTVVVHTLPLSPLPISVTSGQSTKPCYALTLPTDKPLISLSAVIALLAIILGLLVTQSVLEYQGAATSYLGLTQPEVAQKWTNIKKGYAPRGPYVPPIENTPTINTAGGPTTSDPTQHKLHQLLSRLDRESGVVYIREEQDASSQGTDASVSSSIKADLHDEAVHGPHGGKVWEMLSDEEKEIWKGKLTEVGYWAEGMPETLLKSIVFAQLGGVVREAVGAAIGG